jgi:hypothetical protein
MRRFIASLLLSVTAWSFGGPLALGVSGAAASACCRRDGKHHCMSEASGAAGISSDAFPSFRAKPPECPYRSLTAAPTGVAHPRIPAVSQLQSPSSLTILIEDGLFLDQRLVSCNLQRGPPIFYS